jgi:phosphate-selective porin OprO/OprP
MLNSRRLASHRVLILAAGLSLAGASAEARPRHPAQPDPRDARIEALTHQVELLAAKVETLEAKAAAPAPLPPPPPFVAVVQASPPPAPAAAPVKVAAAGGATIVAGKPSIQSPDGRFSANLHGVMQFDVADYAQNTPGPITADLRRGAAAADTAHARDLSSGGNFRRVRLGVDGKAFGDWDYNLLFEYGGTGEEDAGHIQEAWIQYSGLKPFHLRIGAYPPSVGLEDQASTNGSLFPERPAVADVARGLAAGDFRDAVQLWANGARWFASGAVTGRVVGVVNSQATGVSQPFDSQLGLVGRLVFQPVKTDDVLLQLGVHGSYVARPADAGGPDAAATAARYAINLQERPELRVDGTRLISTGSIDARHADAYGLEGVFQAGGLFLQSEYEHFDIERRNVAATVSDPSFEGWYVEGSFIPTGERRRFAASSFTFDSPAPDHPFDLSAGTWGALELTARYSDIDLNYHAGPAGTATPADGVRGGDQRIVSAGVNWYPNTFVKFMLDYQDVRIDRLSPSAATFATPVGAQIGQSYHTVILRSQFAF